MDFLLNKIKQSDVIIIASPCYFLGPHTSIKAIGDRLISVLNNGQDFANKQCLTVGVYGVKGWEGYAREALLNFARFLHLETVGSMLVQAANPGEAAQPDILAQARQLASRLTDGAKTPANSIVHTCQVCDSSLLQVSVNGEVRCVMCGAIGRMSMAGGQYQVDFSGETHKRFSPEGNGRAWQAIGEYQTAIH